MSWAVEEWKDGLPGKALQKIQEMEVQLDKLRKERTQKQFQLDSLEAALQKQKQKVSARDASNVDLQVPVVEAIACLCRRTANALRPPL